MQPDPDEDYRIAFTQTDSLGTTIYTIKSDGSDLEAIHTFPVTKSSAGNLKWAPDGSKLTIYFHNGPLAIINVDGSEPLIYSDLPAVNGGYSWFPDSRRIVFSSSDTIYELDTYSKKINMVTEGKTPEISPDGIQMVYIHNSNLYVKDLNDPDERLIADSVAGGVSWSPSGDRITYMREGQLGVLWNIALNGNEKIRLISGNAVANKPAWSPDGKKIAYIQAYGFGVVDTEGNEDHFISVSGAYFPNWSPSGDTIVYLMLDSSEKSISVIKLDSNDTSLLIPIKTSGTAVWSPIPIE